MEDWRLKERDDNMSRTSLLKIKFPDFWKKSYADKNSFYRKIVEDAQQFVSAMHRGEEFLEGEKVQAFWHEHCEFCWEKFTTDTEIECYCTEDYNRWICSTCFQDFNKKFEWTVKES